MSEEPPPTTNGPYTSIEFCTSAVPVAWTVPLIVAAFWVSIAPSAITTAASSCVTLYGPSSES